SLSHALTAASRGLLAPSLRLAEIAARQTLKPPDARFIVEQSQDTPQAPRLVGRDPGACLLPQRSIVRPLKELPRRQEQVLPRRARGCGASRWILEWWQDEQADTGHGAPIHRRLIPTLLRRAAPGKQNIGCHRLVSASSLRMLALAHSSRLLIPRPN